MQILYVNLATDGLPALALSVDPPEEGLMRRPPRRRGEGIFTRPVVALILTGGAWSALVTLTLFSWALTSGRTLDEAMTLTFATLVLVEFCKAFSYRSDRHSIVRRPFANRWLNLAIAWEVVLLVLVVNVPFLQDAFGTTGLSARGVGAGRRRRRSRSCPSWRWRSASSTGLVSTSPRDPKMRRSHRSLGEKTNLGSEYG